MEKKIETTIEGLGFRVSGNQGSLLVGPHNQDHSISESIGAPLFIGTIIAHEPQWFS